MDVLVGILGLQEQHLGDHEVSRAVVDRTDDEDHALLEQARIDVVGTLAAPALLDHHRDQAEIAGLLHKLLAVRCDGRARVSLLRVEDHGFESIRAAKVVGRSCTWARESAQSTTFLSTANTSNSFRRSGFSKCQRTTASGCS